MLIVQNKQTIWRRACEFQACTQLSALPGAKVNPVRGLREEAGGMGEAGTGRSNTRVSVITKDGLPFPLSPLRARSARRIPGAPGLIPGLQTFLRA